MTSKTKARLEIMPGRRPRQTKLRNGVLPVIAITWRRYPGNFAATRKL